MSNNNTDSMPELELPAINRYALVVKPSEVYLKWAHKYFQDGQDITLEELQSDSTVYLIPEMETGLDTWLMQNYEMIFEYEMDSWCQDRKSWPENPSYEEFVEFFQISLHSIVVDLVED